MDTPTKDEYDAAKQRYNNTTEDEHHNPSDALLEDVRIINAYEQAQGQAER